MMNERLQPGLLDRVFNSTFALPQQFLWRIWRALEDDKIDLFSERGILDFALVPGLGIADSHQHDVMPDYMAEQLGFASEGKSGLGSQLTAAIISDPLSWMTGGSTALAKLGKSAMSASRIPQVASKARAAATANNMQLDEYIGQLGAPAYRKLLGEAAGEMTQLTGKSGKSRKTLEKLIKQFDDSFDEASRIASTKGIEGGLKVGDAIKSTRDRQIALGLPIFSMFGARVNILDGQSSWWDLFKQGIATGGSAVGKSFLWKSVSSLPGVSTALNTIKQPYRHGMFGYREGQSARVMLPQTQRAIEGDEAARYMNYMSTDGGRDMGLAIESNFAKNADFDQKIRASFLERLKKNKTYEEAFVGTMRKFGLGGDESAAALWGRLTGLTKDNDVFPRWASPSVAAASIDKAVSKFRENHLKASKLFSDGDVAVVPAATEARKLEGAYAAERAGMGKYLGYISEKAFETGKAYRGLINKLFRTGEKTDFGASQYATFLSNVARDNDQVEILAAGLYDQLKQVANNQNIFTLDELNKVVANITQLDALPGELAATFKAFELNSTQPGKLLDAMQAFMDRHHAGVVTLEKILKSKGVTNSEARERMLRFFDDDVFPYVERSAEDGKRTFEVSFGSQSPAVDFADELVFTPLEHVRLRRVNNRHVVRSDDLLQAYAGRQAATLTDTQLEDAVGRLSRAATRKITESEVIDTIGSNRAATKAFQAFQKKHGLTFDETLGLLRKRKLAKSYRVGRSKSVEQPYTLWEKTRSQWTGKQVDAELEKLGFRAVRVDDGKLGIEITQLGHALRYGPFGKLKTKGALFEQAATELAKKTHGTYASLMRSVHNYLSKNAKSFEALRPPSKFTDVPISVDRIEVERLTRELRANGIDDELIRGTLKIEDSSLLSANAAADLHRLSELQKRRALPKSHALHEAGQITGRRVKVATGVRAPREPAEVRSLLTKGDEISERPVSDWAREYASARALISEIDDYIKRANKYKQPIQIDGALLARLEGHLASSGAMIREAVESALPAEMRAIFDKTRAISAHTFEAARRAGVWIPGSPIAYLPRYFNKAARERVAKLIGDIDVEDGHILMRLGVKQAQYFKRSLDEMTLEDLDNLQGELRAAINEGTASPKLRELQVQLDNELAEAGIPIAGTNVKLPYDKAKRLEHDPFLSLVQRFETSQQNDTLAGYFDSLLAANTGKNGESLLMGGKVIGIVDDTGRMHKTTRSITEARAAKRAGDDVVDIAEEQREFAYTPKSILIEDMDGKVRVIENGLFNETGFSLMPLARDVSDVAGQKTSLGQAFARASLRSDLHESMIKGVMTEEQASSLIGQQVVFGSQNHMVSAVKAAAQAYQVAPRAWRTFDSINYGIKSFQTIFRLPFHIANLSSGVFQASTAGVSPRNLAASYVDTIRLLFGNQDFSKRAGQLVDMFGVNSDVHSLGIVNLAAGNKSGIQTAARALGSGSFAKFLEKNAADLNLDSVEHLVLRHADGRETDMLEFMQMAGEMQLFGTFASSLARGSTTIADNLTRIKIAALAPDLGGRVKRISSGVMRRFANVAETSEVINRTATALGLIREGHSMRRAIEITKEAHVPYEKLTPFERNFMKRIAAYYTFPRHYIPWAWTRFAEDPAKLANINHFIRDQNVVTTQEGSPTLAVGQYRLNLGRLNANLEAAGMVAAFADRIMLPGMELVSSDVEYDRRFLQNAYSHAGLTAAGGITSMFMDDLIPQGQRGAYGTPDLFRDAGNLIWPFKAMKYMLGREGGAEDASVFTEYSELDSLVTNGVLGVGLRKVRDNHELMTANNRMRALVRNMEMRAAAATTPELRERYTGTIRELVNGFRQLASESAQKDYR